MMNARYMELESLVQKTLEDLLTAYSVGAIGFVAEFDESGNLSGLRSHWVSEDAHKNYILLQEKLTDLLTRQEQIRKKENTQ